jgi:hypothetical protein
MKIRLTTFARPDQDLLFRFSNRYLQGKNKWKDLEFVTDDRYDRLVILTFPHQQTLEKGYDERKSITFMTESSLSSFARQHPTSRMMDVHLHLPFFPANFSTDGESDRVDKTELLSAVVSELAGFPGHRARLEFILALDKVFKDGFDVYGRPSHGRFFNLLNNYKGYLKDKYEGLWKYTYHVACENAYENGYFTEKIVDPIITESLCFYAGCPNLADYINPKAFVRIDPYCIGTSLETIIASVRDNIWAKRLPYILQEKRRFLTDLHPMNMIWMAAHDKDLGKLYNSSL